MRTQRSILDARRPNRAKGSRKCNSGSHRISAGSVSTASMSLTAFRFVVGPPKLAGAYLLRTFYLTDTVSRWQDAASPAVSLFYSQGRYRLVGQTDGGGDTRNSRYPQGLNPTAQMGRASELTPTETTRHTAEVPLPIGVGGLCLPGVHSAGRLKR